MTAWITSLQAANELWQNIHYCHLRIKKRKEKKKKVTNKKHYVRKTVYSISWKTKKTCHVTSVTFGAYINFCHAILSIHCLFFFFFFVFLGGRGSFYTLNKILTYRRFILLIYWCIYLLLTKVKGACFLGFSALLAEGKAK